MQHEIILIGSFGLLTKNTMNSDKIVDGVLMIVLYDEYLPCLTFYCHCHYMMLIISLH